MLRGSMKRWLWLVIIFGHLQKKFGRVTRRIGLDRFFGRAELRLGFFRHASLQPRIQMTQALPLYLLQRYNPIRVDLCSSVANMNV